MARDYNKASLRRIRSSLHTRHVMRVLIARALTCAALVAGTTPHAAHASSLDPDSAIEAGGTEAPTRVVWRQHGVASHYGAEFSGRRTASGSKFDPNALTAAHRTLPFGTRVRVSNVRTGASVLVRITDRGPWIKGRIIDLSHAAARSIGLSGLGQVVVERTEPSDSGATD